MSEIVEPQILLKSPALTRQINRIRQATMDIRTAIENKGVTVPSNAKIEDYANLIDSIAVVEESK